MEGIIKKLYEWCYIVIQFYFNAWKTIILLNYNCKLVPDTASQPPPFTSPAIYCQLAINMLIFKCNSEASNGILWQSEASFHINGADGSEPFMVLFMHVTELPGFSSSTESYSLNHSVKSSATTCICQ